jgi:hypothetical protein
MSDRHYFFDERGGDIPGRSVGDTCWVVVAVTCFWLLLSVAIEAVRFVRDTP